MINGQVPYLTKETVSPSKIEIDKIYFFKMFLVHQGRSLPQVPELETKRNLTAEFGIHTVRRCKKRFVVYLEYRTQGELLPSLKKMPIN